MHMHVIFIPGSVFLSNMSPLNKNFKTIVRNFIVFIYCQSLAIGKVQRIIILMTANIYSKNILCHSKYALFVWETKFLCHEFIVFFFAYETYDNNNYLYVFSIYLIWANIYNKNNTGTIIIIINISHHN